MKNQLAPNALHICNNIQDALNERDMEWANHELATMRKVWTCLLIGDHHSAIAIVKES